MNAIIQLFTHHSIAQAILIFSMVITLGIILGSIRVFGIRLGIAGVLFSGILFGHLQLNVDHKILEFAREFGLILFVYSVGMEVGPGFFSSLKKNGLKLNLLATSIVFIGALITVGFIISGLVPTIAAVGLFSGGTTNTPSLGAVQQTLSMMPDVSSHSQQVPGLAYAIAYPFGIMGIILTMLAIKMFFKVDIQKEQQAYKEQTVEQTPKVASLDFHVENPNIEGKTLGEIDLFEKLGVVVSRVMHKGKVYAASKDTILYLDDIIHAVGPKDKMKDLLVVVGQQSIVDLRHDVRGDIIARKIIVTQANVVGKRVRDVRLASLSDVNITRVIRTGIEFTASDDVELQFADTLIIVGEQGALDKVSEFVGNAPKTLGVPQLMPIFIGIALGVLIGSLPIPLPGVPAPVRLGLAGGPLLVAICLSRLGHVGSIIWYIPKSANFMLRELGIGLFLACVGLHSGDQFLRTLISGHGLYWMGLASLITFVPIFSTAFFARRWLSLNYLSICGLLAGSMTDPPALAFANAQAKSNAMSLAYVTVYPLVMILRILAAQIIVITLI